MIGALCSPECSQYGGSFQSGSITAYRFTAALKLVFFISVYELSRLHTLFLDSFILLLDPKPLHVSAVFCFSHHQVATKLKDLVTQIFNTHGENGQSQRYIR